MTAALARYALVGACATALHYAVLALAVEQAHWPAWGASGVGALCGAQLAFWGNRRYTFAHQGRWPRAWARFHVTAGLGALLGMAITGAGTALGLHYLPAQALATLVAVLAGYMANRRWSFSTG